jgi:glycosyltransferase involved in cell wall biosynthesis
MHIVFVIPYFHPALEYGGQPKSSYDLARSLTRRGHRVTVLTTDSGGHSRLPLKNGFATEHNLEGIQVFYYPNLSNYLAFHQRLFLPIGLFRNIRRHLAGCDLVHVHELRSSPTVAAYKAAKKLQLPFILSTHGGLQWLGKRTAKYMFDKIWGQSILRHASKLIAISPVEEQDARAFGAKAEQIRLLPNAVFSEDYSELPHHGEFRRRWNIRAEKIVLFLGRLHWIKGADLLIDALSESGPSLTNVHLVIAGPDDGQERELRRKIEAAGLTNLTTFTGYLDHAAKLQAFVDAALVAIPSRSEVFAITALEALLCGRPVVLSSACGLFPMPGSDCGVWKFKSENVKDLATTLSTSLSANEFVSSKGREFVIREFSPEAIAKRAEVIYQEAMAAAKSSYSASSQTTT